MKRPVQWEMEPAACPWWMECKVSFSLLLLIDLSYWLICLTPFPEEQGPGSPWSLPTSQHREQCLASAGINSHLIVHRYRFILHFHKPL